MRRRYLLVAVGILCAGLIGVPAMAQIDPPVDPGSGCSCDTISNSTCTPNGWRVILKNFQVDQNAGESVWTYSVCNETGLGTGCDTPYPLDYIDFALPLIGSCMTEGQSISMTQVSGFANATVTCDTVTQDTICGLTSNNPANHISQCKINSPSTLDAGECVDLELRIGGEMPTLGPGFSEAIAKGPFPDCSGSCVLGPSCTPCAPPPPPDVHQCLTRTIGFWGNHPAITQLYANPSSPITVCGEPLTKIEAGTCDSITEALCSNAKDDKNTAYLALVRQLAAAKLNLAASSGIDGECGSEIAARIAQCEQLCDASKSVISNSGCIEDLDAFNNSQDEVGGAIPPFDQPGPANPEYCKAARGNHLAIGKKTCDQ